MSPDTIALLIALAAVIGWLVFLLVIGSLLQGPPKWLGPLGGVFSAWAYAIIFYFVPLFVILVAVVWCDRW